MDNVLSGERGHRMLTQELLDAGVIIEHEEAGIIPANPEKYGCCLYELAADYIKALERMNG